MKHLSLILANLKRKKLRTVLTILSIAVAFLLFGYLGRGIFVLAAGVMLTVFLLSLRLPVFFRECETPQKL